jgi:hypothetical protein
LTTERRGNVATRAALEQNDNDDEKADHNVNGNDQTVYITHVFLFS